MRSFADQIDSFLIVRVFLGRNPSNQGVRSIEPSAFVRAQVALAEQGAPRLECLDDLGGIGVFEAAISRE